MYVPSPRTVVLYPLASSNLFLPISVPLYEVHTVHVCVCVSFRPVDLGVNVRVCIKACVCVSLLSVRTSSPIRLLCSVMGAQGGLRSAP